jgi:XTP/dITP diphosphohydrolase
MAMEQKTLYYSGFPKGKIAYFVTSNIHKFLEARNVLAEYKIATAKLKVEAIEIQDDNLENIARFSVLDAVNNCNLPVFVEDAGIFIEALKGFPGPYSKFVFNTVTLKGILKLMDGVENRNAYFMSVIAFSSPREQPTCFVGKVNGKISLQQKGNSGFGYDPIFIPDNSDGKTFAELTANEKNSLSHRGEALRLFAKWYSSQNERRF